VEVAAGALGDPGAACSAGTGLKLYLITTPDGMSAVWCLADPKIGEREVAADPFAWKRVIAVVCHGTGGVRGNAAGGRAGSGLRSTSPSKAPEMSAR
jgi:hypothetical protein